MRTSSDPDPCNRSGCVHTIFAHFAAWSTSAVVLTFRSASWQFLSSERQNQNRTSTLESLVPLCFRRSHERVPQSDASVGSGTLAHASTGSSHAEGRRPQAAVDAGERAELSRRSL